MKELNCIMSPKVTKMEQAGKSTLARMVKEWVHQWKTPLEQRSGARMFWTEGPATVKASGQEKAGMF